MKTNVPTNIEPPGAEADPDSSDSAPTMPGAGSPTAAKQKRNPANSRRRSPRPGERLSVPATAHKLSPYDFPLSTRLTNVLKKRGITRLGELDGIALSDLQEFESCGWKTAAELVRLTKRIAAGEFALSGQGLSAESLAAMLHKIEDLIAALPPREREMVLLRIGAGRDQRVWTLRKIGLRYHVTRERVRQVVDKMLAWVRAGGGPGLAGQLGKIVSTTAQRACPLTVPLLSQWLPGAEPPRRFPLPCYVRILGGLDEQIPAWPHGQGPSGSQEGRARTVVTVLEGILEKQDQLSARRAFELTSAHAGLRGLTVPEFLAALKSARRILFDFPKPDRPVVRLRRKRP